MVSNKSAVLAVLVMAVTVVMVVTRAGFYWSGSADVQAKKKTNVAEETAPCKLLGLPQDRNLIPLPDSAFHRTRGTATTNYVVGTLTSVTPHILMALPRSKFSDRVNRETGFFTEGWNWQLKDTNVRASNANPDDGAFIDVGGWIGDTSLPTAAVGIETYVFEPVRFNYNLIQISMLLNDCTISEHLTIVNALVGNNNTITKVFAPDNIANSGEPSAVRDAVQGSDSVVHEEEVGMVKLDSFFPPGKKVQHLKIDVQGFEFEVIKGAERLLRENVGRLKLRFEADVKMLNDAGSSSQEIVGFLENIGYKVTKKGSDIDME